MPLVLFFPCFLTTALACQRFFHPLLLAWLQVKGVTFHFLDDVLLLYLSFEAAKCVFEGLALLNSDFSQTNYTPQLVRKLDPLVMASPAMQVKRNVRESALRSEDEPHSQLHQPWSIRVCRPHEVCRLLIISRIWRVSWDGSRERDELPRPIQ
jgi:hypothetical protein